ncbi:MAG: dicarboxylate/amino acid:cation symporter [Chlamydiae bacterium]|nr:dicarboxylate/amino acid:cation symporter [Chlamydiota bacterium]
MSGLIYARKKQQICYLLFFYPTSYMMNNFFKKIGSLLSHRGIQTAVLIALYFSFEKWLPVPFHQMLYTISLFIKDLLMGVLPLTLFFFIAHTLTSFQKKAPLFILTLVLFETFSNLLCVEYGLGCTHILLHYLPPLPTILPEQDFQELWRLPFNKPSWWSADKGALVALMVGSFVALTKNAFLQQKLAQGKNLAQTLITQGFSRCSPLFVIGFVAKIHHTDLIRQTLRQSSCLILSLTFFLIFYLLFLFLVGASFHLPKTLRHLRHLLPAGSLAFLSGCSLSTMPWTIRGTSKNLKNPHLAHAIIPATTNIQQVGDCIAQSFLCSLLYTYFYGHPPEAATWLLFSTLFVLARFATAAMLGGAIFIMLPIYESTLRFTPEMISIILAFNTLLDPLITSSNVLANGALCGVFEKIWGFLEHQLSKNKPQEP